MVKPDYYDELTRIRAFMAVQTVVRMPYMFPVKHCDHTSFLAAEVLGLKVTYGDYEGSPHTLNEDPNLGIYIDLTRTQFGIQIPPIVIEGRNNTTFVRDSEQASRSMHEDLKRSIGDCVNKLLDAYRSFRR